jgi:DNA-binding NarL/FixJ family response regulator
VAVRVLLVDDSEVFRETARLVVESTDGFTVVAEASTGEEGAELATQADLVVLDHHLPGIDGIETLARIREVAPAVQVLLCSSDSAVVSRAEAAGVTFVPKDEFGPDVLLRLAG